MKILIVATPRSGSTSLLRAISTELKLIRYGEPWNTGIRLKKGVIKYPIEEKDSYVVKCICDQFPPSLDTNPIDFFTEYIKEFDKVILLSRQDKRAAYESFMYSDLNRESYYWHKPYFIESTEGYENYKVKTEYFYKLYELIELISIRSNKPIYWYEDIYSGDKDKVIKVLTELGLEEYYDNFQPYIDPKFRYRQFQRKLI